MSKYTKPEILLWPASEKEIDLDLVSQLVPLYKKLLADPLITKDEQDIENLQGLIDSPSSIMDTGGNEYALVPPKLFFIPPVPGDIIYLPDLVQFIEKQEYMTNDNPWYIIESAIIAWRVVRRSYHPETITIYIAPHQIEIPHRFK